MATPAITPTSFPRGSEWRKWDLHVHTPASVVHNYGGPPDVWSAFLSDLEALPPEFKVLGVNDYIFLDGYRRLVQERKNGRLKNIDLLLPVIELRLDKFGGSPGHFSRVASLVGTIITTFGLFVVPGLPRLGTLYSSVSGFGSLLIVLAVYGLFTVGWRGVLAFFVGKLLAGMVSAGIEFWRAKRIRGKMGASLWRSEINFFNAYRLHASDIGKSTDITLADEELSEDNWKPCFEDLARKWPEVVRRFTIS